MNQYRKTTDADGRPVLETDLPGLAITRLPLLNKGTGFPDEERTAFGLHGLFPDRVSPLEEQVDRAYDNVRSFSTNLDKHIFLRVLQDRNEVLFYALLEQHLEEMMPLIYTPTVAEAVEQFSRIYRYPRGLMVSRRNIDRIDELLEYLPVPEVQLAVATDAEGILGIGDQGVGGMAICIGKLSIYTAAAGVDPGATLPVMLDVGTDRRDLLDDPFYLGARHERLRGDAYFELLDRFVEAFARRFPRAVLQWEDFSKQNAFAVLERYRDRVPSFNDDVQGTGAVVLAGLLAAARRSQRPLADERFLVHGAGAGGVGVAELIRLGLVREGLSDAEARERIFMIDSRGLVLADRAGLEPYKAAFAQPASRVAGWELAGEVPSLLETIRQGGVTALLGLSGQRGAFTREVVEAVDANTPYPIVFPLSNPTANSEALPEDVIAWTEGRAVVATGSPFDDVSYQGAGIKIGQGNNAFVFPGLGLGALLSGARQITPTMLTDAAAALADYTDAGRIAQGAVYPRIGSLRSVSRQVALAVARRAAADGVASGALPDDLEAAVDETMWQPRYLPLRRA